MGWLCKNVTKLGFVILPEIWTVLCQDLIAVTRFPSVFPSYGHVTIFHAVLCQAAACTVPPPHQHLKVNNPHSATVFLTFPPSSCSHVVIFCRSVHGCHVPFLWKVLRKYFPKSFSAFPNMFGPESLEHHQNTTSLEIFSPKDTGPRMSCARPLHSAPPRRSGGQGHDSQRHRELVQ